MDSHWLPACSAPPSALLHKSLTLSVYYADFLHFTLNTDDFPFPNLTTPHEDTVTGLQQVALQIMLSCGECNADT